ncbi:hypothetical protein ACVGOW_33830 [Pseudonocardia saturnea]
MKVHAGIDQLTGEKLWLRQTVPTRETRQETEEEAEKALTRLLDQVDERRSPKTEATVEPAARPPARSRPFVEAPPEHPVHEPVDQRPARLQPTTAADCGTADRWTLLRPRGITVVTTAGSAA